MARTATVKTKKVAKPLATKTSKKVTTTTTRAKVAKVLTTEELKTLVTIDKKITALYAKKEEILTKVCSERGEVEGVLKTKGEKPFIRVRVKDNLKALKSGTVFKSTSFTRFAVEISRLKNDPTAKATKTAK